MKHRFGLGVAILAALAASGCQRMDHLGKAPSFSAMQDMPPANGAAMPPNRQAAGQMQAAMMPNPYRSDAGGMSRGIQNASVSSIGVPQRTSGSLWSSDPKSLFGDRRAKAVGDILTVMIEIDDEAELSNSTARSRSGGENATVEGLYGLETIANAILPGDGLATGVAADSSSNASGQGQVSRNEAISLKIAARVVEVLDTGHLVITGRQEVRVNFELRDLQVVGLIRPEDISRNNDITYDKMAEARISYGGRGHISDVQQARYGQQVWDMISPF